MTFYLKYRPQTIEQLDSKVVREQLTNLINSGNMPHAFLFSGPKGTGKTSAARILAKIINCEKNQDKLGEPCNKCESCLAIGKGSSFDVIEMDAASNRGIDDIRALKEKIMLSPGMSRKKIYIIDEVHMLTTEAFNALLKTLEEPPAHVVFILATTDPQKLPDTVKSRLTNINFEKAKEDEVVRQLTRVAKEEKIDIPDDSLKAISKASGGAFRDSVKNLEQIVMNLKQFDLEAINDYLFNTKLLTPSELLSSIFKKDSKKAVESIEKYAQGGGSIPNLIDGMISVLHGHLLSVFGLSEKQDFEVETQELHRLVELLQAAKVSTTSSVVTQLPLEIAILTYINDDSLGRPETPKQQQQEDTQSKKKDLKTEVVKNNDTVSESTKVQESSSYEDSITKLSQALPVSADPIKVDAATWMNILNTVRSFSPSVEGFLRAAKLLKCEQGVATIGVHYRFHKEQLENLTNRKILQDCLSDILGTTIRVEMILTEKVEQPKSPQIMAQPSLTQVQAPDILDAAKEIFG